MKPRSIISILTFALLFDTGCSVDTGNFKVATNDTTQVLKLVIDSAFYPKNFLDFKLLKQNNPFGDTIIFKFDSIFVGHLPSTLKYKLLSKDEICRLATLYYKDKTDFCNFLELCKFKKNDNTYEVILKNQCVKPLYDKNGKALFHKDFYKDWNYSQCAFGQFCNCGIAITITKSQDTLKTKIDSSWSTSWRF